MPSSSKETTSLPYRHRIHLIGLGKRRLRYPHLCIFGKCSVVMILGMIPGRIFFVGSLASDLTAATYSPFGVETTLRSLTGIPWPLANPSAALVGLPLSSKATDLAGPMTSLTLLSCASATPVMCRTIRLGVA